MTNPSDRCTHCGLSGPGDTEHDQVDCAKRVAAAGRAGIHRAVAAHLVSTGDLVRASERADALLNYWAHHTAEYLREYAATEALFGKEGLRLAADLIDPEAQR